jgi:hypothetical protein
MSLLSLINAGNIALVATLILISSFKNVFAKGAVILVASLFIKFRAGFDPSNIAFFAALVLGALLQEKLPFARGLNVFISLVASFAAFNAYLLFL